MKHSDSLRILAEWAGRVPSRFPYPPAPSMAERDAVRHGTAAVRAVRDERTLNETDPYITTCICDEAISEARLAVRAALRAVGLKTL